MDISPKSPTGYVVNDNIRSKLAAKDFSNSLDSLNSVYKKRLTHVGILAVKGPQFPGIIAVNYSLLQRVSSKVITKLSCESDRGEVQTVQLGLPRLSPTKQREESLWVCDSTGVREVISLTHALCISQNTGPSNNGRETGEEN